MIESNIPFKVKKIVQFIDKGKIVLDHYCQRPSGVWKQDRPSLLIHSLLMGFPVPPLYSVKDNGIYSVLDGKQRLTVIQGFLHDEWTLIKDMPEVYIDNIEYDISGLKFSKLPTELKEQLEDADLLLYVLEDCTDEQIEESFFRLNYGVDLSLEQKNHAKLGKELTAFINETINLPFFKTKAKFTNYQLSRGEDESCILQTMMLVTSYEYKSFGNTDILRFIEFYKDNYKQSELDEIKALFEKLNEAFPEKNKLLQKINIPMFVITLKASQELDIPFSKYCEWANKFIVEYDSKDEYGLLCSGGTAKGERVKARVDYMSNSLLEYVTQTEKEA